MLLIVYKRSLFISFLLLCVIFQLDAQQKQPLTPADYGLWHSFSAEKISDDGKWVSFGLQYQNGADTTVVQNTGNERLHYFFPGGTGAVFSPGAKWHACLMKERGLVLLQLNSGIIRWIPDVTGFEFTAGGRYLCIMTKQDNQPVLKLIPLQGGAEMSIANVREYNINANGNALVLIQASNAQQQVRLLRFSGRWEQQLLSKDSFSAYSGLTWQAKGNALAYIQDKGPQSLWLYDLSATLPIQMPALPEGQKIAEYSPIIISSDARHVFFSLKPIAVQTWKDTIVKIWHVKDPWVYPQRQDLYGFSNLPKLYLWNTGSNGLVQVTTNEYQQFMLTRDQQHVLLYNRIPDEPQFTQADALDVYLLNMQTGQRQLLASKLENYIDNAVEMSPGGQFIAYYKEKRWWVYDLKTNLHKNITAGIPTELETTSGQSGSDGSAYQYGVAGWTGNDQGLLVYDQYDCWLVTLDGKSCKRLTNGREQRIRFRLYDSQSGSDFYRYKPRIQPPDTLVFEARGEDRSSGYFLRLPNGAMRPIAYGARKIQGLKSNRDRTAYIYLQQTFDEAPSLMYHKKGLDLSRKVWQSNPQQERFGWGHAEMIGYRNSKGDSLKAALIYPPGYIPCKKYPMIVQIYQQRSWAVYEYEEPTLNSGAALNTTVYALEGYLQLLPDISYTVGNTGMSATDCVESAVKMVIKKGLVDPSRIGLIGHSFGGYETNFIVTQSKLFAAAISGAGISDLVKSYFTINEEHMHEPNIWRYEMQQMRMRYMFFDNPSAYLRNSPIHQAATVSTPLLLWTGENDRNVHSDQSVEYHLALRRLHKQSVLLVYPDERHIIMSPNKQEDLTLRCLQWFDHYLKGSPAAEWIIKGNKMGDRIDPLSVK